jgi:dipeptidyl aminopeptidase/acylaminoacyl peptidase
MSIRHRFLVLHAAILVLLFAAAPGRAQDTSARWTVNDILGAESAGSFDISRDGRWVVWTKSEVDLEKSKRFSNLWITRIADGESWALTHGKDSFGSPHFSPDGELIAFTSSREVPDKPTDATGSQLWVMRTDGGEPWSITTSVRGLRQFDWKGESADTILFTAQEGVSQYDREKKKEEDTAYAVEDTLDSPPVRIWSIAVKSRAIRRLTDNTDPIQAMALSPDGKRAITRNTVSLSYGFDEKQPPSSYIVDLATGGRRQILTRPIDHDGRPFRIVPGAFSWSPDGGSIYIAYAWSNHPVYRSATITLLGQYDPDADRFERIDLQWPRALSSMDAVPGGFVALLEDGVHVKPALFTRGGTGNDGGNGWTREWIEGSPVGRFLSWTVSHDGKTVAYVSSTASTPPQPFVATLDAEHITAPKKLATLNPSFAKKKKVRAEVVHWKGANGDDVEGILYYPFDYHEGRRYPLIQSIHGGPAGADRDAWSQGWSAPVLLYLEKGAFALKTNYHGSCCYGIDWVESIGNGKYYSLEVPDLEKGVDALIAKGLVHPDSIATAGWSNGAILSTALNVANPKRYRAAVVGAGDVEWISDWGNVDFGASFDNYYFGSSPIENPQRYIELSPYFKLDRVRTPTLLFTGTEDRNVPPSQSWSHFRALQQLGNTETRLVLFPGEPHGLGKLPHQRRKVEEEMRWLDRFLWGRPDTANLALADNSPLAALLKLRPAKRVDGMLGERINGILVPETARRDSLEVGRFEVTRAQWQAFEPVFTIEPGTGNHPVNGVTFDRAQAYVRWLAQKTGRPFRLPTKAERDALGGSGGNTLDAWAGYAVNPEDAERLGALIATLSGDAPLLRDAGTSGDASGEPAIWDLGGNVAEWTTGSAGAGVLTGGSADRPKDSATKERDAGVAYRGLRVVVGTPH